MVLNSAGLSGLGSVAPDRRNGVVRLLRGLDAIAVRDAPSARYLERIGIRHALVPDAVHALGVVEPAIAPAARDTAILQVSTAVLDAMGVDALAQAERPEAGEHAAALAWRAHEHLEDLAAQVLAVARDETAADWAARAARRVHAPSRAPVCFA